MAQNESTKEVKSFKDTLNLPNTEFPIRPNQQVDDALLLERWEKEKLYTASFECNIGKEKYILHDGPPYANGHIHLGHAYNKILKDIVTKARRMAGYHVPVTPGWDCHGLPIELKVVQENPGLNRIALKQACRKYANKWIDIQRTEFKALGVLMDWDKPYITMSPDYEAATVRAFGAIVRQGFIERKNKTVPWCPNDQTVLATAEIEYKDRKDPSIYVLFDLQEADVARLFPNVKAQVSLVIWTTTPWTLPLNQAVLVNPVAHYVLLEINTSYIIVGSLVADKLCKLLDVEKKVVQEFPACYLSGLFVKHPFINKCVPLVFDESVGVDEGTAFVHCAPGCGPLDYEIGVKNNLPIYSPITPDGKYSQEIELKELITMPVSDGQIWVIKKLAELKKLLFKTSITHSYPHCWRCHGGLIFRATPQWFFDLDRQGIKEKAVQDINTMSFIPDRGRNFLKATVENRWEWCLSRQRIWGVPIPALLCTKCDKSYLIPELIDKVAAGIERHGIEFWDTVNIKDLVGTDFVCACGSEEFKKEQDILDVWFDSGVSHYAVLYHNKQLAFPADLYLEGIDQYRGWFQSSLLTSLVLEKEPCTKAIMSHGFTVDANGQKMSKSLGNVVAPEDIIKQLGTDGLRLWVASIGHDSDAVVSDVLLRNVSEVYRKVRNTCRFLLSNLYDFNPEFDAIKPQDLLTIDRYALVTLSELNGAILNDYEHYDITGVFHKLAEYCAADLSAFYLDIVKDRLYVEQADGHLRRSAQTALWHILDTLTRLIAPVMSFTAELVSDHYQKDKQVSIHLQPFRSSLELRELCCPDTEPLWPAGSKAPLGIAPFINYEQERKQDRAYDLEWELVKKLRSAILKALETEREKGLIKHSLEASVKLYVDMQHQEYKPLQSFLQRLKDQNIDAESFFKELLIVSQFSFASSDTTMPQSEMAGVYVVVEKAQGTKCPRCWQWDITTDPDGLCRRCQRVLNK